MGCDTCTYADEHGCWPPGRRGTHCRDCHRDWSGTTEIHCVQCHQHFSCLRTLERHQEVRGGHLVCHDPVTVLKGNGEPMFSTRQSPYGVTWIQADERQPAFLVGAA